MKNNIPFNKPYQTGFEIGYIQDSILKGKTCGNGEYTQYCQHFFEDKLKCLKCLLTTSCTDALEMSAILAGIKPGDEVIVPSYTFVSSALAFVRQGATIVFADSRKDNPCIDESTIESLITPRTKAIVPVHYAGIACDMDMIMEIAHRHHLLVIEDAAQAVDAFYKGRPLGTIGHLAAFSFHETKNIQCGEGGLLIINDERFLRDAEIVWEKGTNRAEFFRGIVNKYSWVGKGSSFLPAEYVAAFLKAQLDSFDLIQQRRRMLWERYNQKLQAIPFQLPQYPAYATNNAHAYYAVCRSLDERTRLMHYLKEQGISTAFHYLSLHKSSFSQQSGWDKSELPEADRYTDCLIRFPFFFELTPEEVDYICMHIHRFYQQELS